MRRLTLAVLALLATLSAGKAAAGVSVRVREEVVVRGPEITLLDIATIDGDDPGLRSRLESIALGPAALPGSSRRLDLDYLRLRLRQHKVDLAKVALSAPERIVVTTDAQRVGPEAILEAARAEVERLLPATGEPRELRPVSLPRELLLPVGALSFKVTPRGNGESGGVFPLVVEVSVDGRVHRSLSLAFRLERFRDVVVATRSMARQTQLVSEDVRVERRPSSSLPGDVLLRPEDAIGLQATKAVAAGEILTARAVQPRPLIRKGEVVTLVAEGQGIRVSTLGEAREEGRRGQLVRVLNLSSRKEIYGRVDGDRVIRILY